MNPSSSSVLELGTRDHPYKSLDFPFIEIFNYGSRDENVVAEINVMEGTLNELSNGYAIANQIDTMRV